MSRFKRFTHRDKRSIKHEVGGTTFLFYPNRLSLLTEARDLSEPIAQAVNILFADDSKDNDSSVKRQHEGDFWMEDVQTKAINPEMATYRIVERGKAITTIMGALADPRALILLGRLFMDSLRDEFPYNPDRGAQEVEEWLYGETGEDAEYHGLELPDLMDLFRGWMKANAKCFGEAGEQMVGAIRKKLAGIQDSDSEPTEPTNGPPSKSPSSTPSDTGSPQSTSTD